MNTTATTAPWPLVLRLRRADNVLEIEFDDGACFVLEARLLRAMTPSAADRGHGGPVFAPLMTTPASVRLDRVEPVGRYAVRLVFGDGHDSGLYTWERLHRIGREAGELRSMLDAVVRQPAF